MTTKMEKAGRVVGLVVASALTCMMLALVLLIAALLVKSAYGRVFG